MIRVSKRFLRRLVVIPPALALLALAVWGLFLLGVRVTPPGAPVIYAPAVRRTETYRQKAQTWLAEMQAVDGELARLLSAPPADVYDLSQEAQSVLDDAADLSQAVSLIYPPAGLVSLRDGLQAAADAYLAAAVQLNLWVGEPVEAGYLDTLESIRLARAASATLAANPWLRDE